MPSRVLAVLRRFQVFDTQSRIAVLEYHLLQRPAQHALHVRVRGALEPAPARDVLYGELTADAPQLHAQQPAKLGHGGWLEDQHLLEAPPDGGIQHALVVGGGDDQTSSFVGVEHLQDGVDDPAELAMLRGVLAFLAQGVEFVEERDHGRCGNEIEHLAEVGGGLAEKG